MRRCIDLARLGGVNVAPNPMVGAVIVVDDKIIGEGYHAVFGGPHAEVNAINSVSDKSQLNKATLYVSLEPCSHHGKTPPCADLIIQHQFKKVVIGCVDTFSKVCGSGICAIKASGINVELGVLEKECRELNKRFFTFHERKRPYVILKWAQSRDGYLDGPRVDGDVGIRWVSAPETRALVHKWRGEESSILVGRKTVQNDNPSLTVRDYSGQNPVRIIIDSQAKLSENLNVFSDDAKTIIFNRRKDEQVGNIEWIKIQELSTELILSELYNRNILSVFVEGGSRTLQYFIFDNVWDEARVIVGNVLFGGGTKAPVLNRTPAYTVPFDSDMIYHYFRK